MDHLTAEREMKSSNAFKEIVDLMAEQYPHRKIKVKKSFDNEIVQIDGHDAFCITGSNLLANITRLSYCLKSEML